MSLGDLLVAGGRQSRSWGDSFDARRCSGAPLLGNKYLGIGIGAEEGFVAAGVGFMVGAGAGAGAGLDE